MTAVTPDSGATAALPLLDELQAAIASDDRTRARQLAARLLEEDALALLKDLDPAALSRLFRILGDETLADLLERLDERDAADILERMNVAEAADVL